MIDWEKVVRYCEQVGHPTMAEKIRHPQRQIAEQCIMLLIQEAAKGTFTKQDGSGSIRIGQVIEFCKEEARQGFRDHWNLLARRIQFSEKSGMIARDLMQQASLGKLDKVES
jgi:hypothetical protein